MKTGIALAILALLLAACSSSGDAGPRPGPSDAAKPGQDASAGPRTPPSAPDAFPARLRLEWRTDFDTAIVSPSEVTQGAPKDAIPAISEPKFLSVHETTFLRDREPVIAFQIGDDARAYPLQIMTWHEIVNDFVDNRPVLITFCPLCNTAIAFDRQVGNVVLDFGVSGFLRNSDLIMFDRDTESWWQQVTGEAIVGHFVGTRLEMLPSTIVAWADFREAFPNGKVLSRNTGFARPYGENPYVGYDDINSSPFLFFGLNDPRLRPMERVATVEIGEETAAYPFSRLEAAGVVHDSVGGVDVVVFYRKGTVSALDQRSIPDSRDVGAAAVFLPEAGGRQLTFSAGGNAFVDNETGSTWDIFGRATAGPLRGARLEPVISGNHFWFAWVAFKPETRVWAP